MKLEPLWFELVGLRLLPQEPVPVTICNKT